MKAVIPAKAGIYLNQQVMDSHLHGNDEKTGFPVKPGMTKSVTASEVVPHPEYRTPGCLS